MYAVGAIICGVIAYYIYPVGVFSIPFAQLTLGQIFSLIGSILFGLATIISWLVHIGIIDAC